MRAKSPGIHKISVTGKDFANRDKNVGTIADTVKDRKGQLMLAFFSLKSKRKNFFPIRFNVTGRLWRYIYLQSFPAVFQ